jgi:hypothetical protein
MFTVNMTLVNYSSRVVPAGVTALMLATIPLMVRCLTRSCPEGEECQTSGWA